MPTFEITAPDGRVFEVEGPEGATAEQALAQVQAQYQPRQETLVQQLARRGIGIGADVARRGPLGAIAGQVGQAVQNLDQAADVAGGKTTDVLSGAVPPEVAAAAGTAVKMAPAAIGAGTGGALGRPVMEAGAKRVMHSALKPSSEAIMSGDAAKAIDTLLREGGNVTPGGVAKLRALVDKLHGEVAGKVKAAAEAGATVDKGYVGSEVYQTLQKFRNQLNSKADEAAILKSWEETSEKLASKIPVDTAQSLKQGTYKILADKYAKAGRPAVENEAATQAQMAGARGLRKGIEDAVPGVAELNKRESEIINAIELAERRAGVSGNRDLAGIAWLANHPAAMAAMLADRSPLFKSMIARLLYEGRAAAPAGAGAVGTATAIQGQER